MYWFFWRFVFLLLLFGNCSLSDYFYFVPWPFFQRVFNWSKNSGFLPHYIPHSLFGLLCTTATATRTATMMPKLIWGVRIILPQSQKPPSTLYLRPTYFRNNKSLVARKCGITPAQPTRERKKKECGMSSFFHWCFAGGKVFECKNTKWTKYTIIQIEWV